MWLLSAKYGKSGRKNTNRLPTTSTLPCQGQPRHPMPAHFNKYFWTHGRGRHKGGNCNSKSPRHKNKVTMESMVDGSNYGYTQWRCGTAPKVATNNNRNILLKYTDSTLVPPNLMSYKHAVLKNFCKTIILKSYTGETVNYIRIQDTIILNNPGPTTTGTRAHIPNNSIIQHTLSGHITLPMLPSTSTQSHAYRNLKSSGLLSRGQLCDSNCSALFTKRTSPFSTQTRLLYSVE